MAFDYNKNKIIKRRAAVKAEKAQLQELELQRIIEEEEEEKELQKSMNLT